MPKYNDFELDLQKVGTASSFARTLDTYRCHDSENTCDSVYTCEVCPA